MLMISSCKIMADYLQIVKTKISLPLPPTSHAEKKFAKTPKIRYPNPA